MDRSSLQLKSIENKLLKAAEGYKDTTNIKKQLLAEAATDGLDDEEALAVVNNVLKRLKKTESGKKGNMLGKAHDPIKQQNNLALFIAALRGY